MLQERDDTGSIFSHQHKNPKFSLKNKLDFEGYKHLFITRGYCIYDGVGCNCNYDHSFCKFIKKKRNQFHMTFSNLHS